VIVRIQAGFRDPRDDRSGVELDRPLPVKGAGELPERCPVRLLRRLLLIAAVILAVARPAAASSITVLVGDKDWFGTQSIGHGKVAGVDLAPWDDSKLWDWRSLAEQGAGNGRQLTDLYSALYPYPPDSGCTPANDPGCTPNGTTGFVSVPLSGTLQSGSISMLMGGFQCSEWGPITVNINGVSVPFCFDDGTQGTALRTFVLTPAMIAAANLDGEVRVNFIHNNVVYGIDHDTGIDYFGFDYFEMNAEVAPVPEPATLALLGLGLAGLAARRRLRVR
jgi:hypothetical protein